MAWPLSIVTDEISQDLDTCRAFLREHGLNAVEIRCASNQRVPDLPTRDLDTIAAWLSDGIAVRCVSPGTFKGDVSDRARLDRELRETLPRAIELAVKWDAPFVVTFTFENPRRTAIERVTDAEGIASAARDLLAG